MQLTDAEKLLLLMLSDIREHLKIEGEDAEKLILLMLEQIEGEIGSDNTGGLAWGFQGIIQCQGETPVTAAQIISVLKERKHASNRS